MEVPVKTKKNLPKRQLSTHPVIQVKKIEDSKGAPKGMAIEPTSVYPNCATITTPTYTPSVNPSKVKIKDTITKPRKFTKYQKISDPYNFNIGRHESTT